MEVPDPDLTVAVVSWNTRDMLASCLDALLQACSAVFLPGEAGLRPMSYEVVLVDNASRDGSQEMVRERFPRVQVIRNSENAGFSRANNQAIRASRGRYVLLLNTDAFIDAATLEKLVRLMEAHPEIGIAGPTLVYPDGSPQVSHGRLPTLWSEVSSLFGLDKLNPQPNRELLPGGDGFPGYIETGTVEGASLLARREALDRVGLLDEGFFFFSEEVDLCCRVGGAGWKVVYVPETRVVHVGGGSTGVVPRRVLLLYQAKLQYFEKHYGSRERSQLLAAMRISIALKVAAHWLMRYLTFGKINKIALWRDISIGFEDYQSHPVRV